MGTSEIFFYWKVNYIWPEISGKEENSRKSGKTAFGSSKEKNSESDSSLGLLKEEQPLFPIKNVQNIGWEGGK